jgi:hypothetical protein
MNVNFVIPKSGKYAEYISFSGDIDENWALFNNGQWAWIIQTYHRMLEFGVNCKSLNFITTPTPCKDSINVIYTDDYNRLDNKHNYYCIVIVLDRKVFFPGNTNVIQNKNSVRFVNTEYKTHWSQAGLITRNNNIIKHEILNVGFFGIPNNTVDLAKIIKSAFGGKVKYHEMGPERWNDYSNIDVAIAIRSYDKKTYNNKPPTKLINAWKAGVLFIGGNDSAYDQTGENGVNYLKVSSEKELIINLKYIVENIKFRNDIINNGHNKYLTNYTNEMISNEWILFFESQVALYLSWKQKPHICKMFETNVNRFFCFYLKLLRRFKIAMKIY